MISLSLYVHLNHTVQANVPELLHEKPFLDVDEGNLSPAGLHRSAVCSHLSHGRAFAMLLFGFAVYVY